MVVSLAFKNAVPSSGEESWWIPQPVRLKDDSHSRGFVFFPEDETALLTLIAAEQSGQLNRMLQSCIGQNPRNMGFFNFLQSEDGTYCLTERTVPPQAHTSPKQG